MKKLILSALVLSAALMGCSKNEKTENPAPAGTNLARANGTVTITGTVKANLDQTISPFNLGALDSTRVVAIADSTSNAYMKTFESGTTNRGIILYFANNGSDNVVENVPSGKVVVTVQFTSLNLTNKNENALENSGVKIYTGEIKDGAYSIPGVDVGSAGSTISVKILPMVANVTFKVKATGNNVTTAKTTYDKNFTGKYTLSFGSQNVTAVSGDTYIVDFKTSNDNNFAF